MSGQQLSNYFCCEMVRLVENLWIGKIYQFDQRILNSVQSGGKIHCLQNTKTTLISKTFCC